MRIYGFADDAARKSWAEIASGFLAGKLWTVDGYVVTTDSTATGSKIRAALG